MAGGDNGARSFMSHDERGNAAPRRAIVPMDITAADAAGTHLDQDFVSDGDWSGGIDDAELLVFGEKERFHAGAILKDPDQLAVTNTEQDDE